MRKSKCCSDLCASDKTHGAVGSPVCCRGRHAEHCDCKSMHSADRRLLLRQHGTRIQGRQRADRPCRRPCDPPGAGRGGAIAGKSTCLSDGEQRLGEVAIAGVAVLVFEPESIGCAPGLLLQCLVLLLGEIDELAIVAEIHVAQFRMPVETERFDNEGLELAGEKVCQEEGGDILVPSRGEVRVSCKEGIAMRTRDSCHPFLFTEPVDQPAGAAIGIGEKDVLEAARPRLDDTLSQPGCDFLRRIVPDGGQTAKLDVLQPVGLADGKDLARNRTASYNMNFLRLCTFSCRHCTFHLNSALYQHKGIMVMTTKSIATIGAVLIALATLSSCANTIRGAGQDTANAVNATQGAGNRVARAAN
ncbi:conserved hypothetical protein [Sinorhizobium medicae]|uniref:Uncharacterized protein n=2 Tax=Sinorhizobium medicae TaxID=110321 RepID=A0A508WUN0_9HYPH|nr:conserved hypothetical protein [Sinorhizobium medicae]